MNGEGRANNWLFTEWMADGCLFWCGVQIAIIIEQKGVCLNGTKRQPKVHYTVIFFSFWALPFIRFSFSRFFSCQNDHTSHSIRPSPANKINNIWRQQAANLQQFWYIKKHVCPLPIEYSFRHFCVRHFIWYYHSVSSPNCQLVCRTHQNKTVIAHFLSVHSSHCQHKWWKKKINGQSNFTEPILALFVCTFRTHKTPTFINGNGNGIGSRRSSREETDAWIWILTYFSFYLTVFRVNFE